MVVVLQILHLVGDVGIIFGRFDLAVLSIDKDRTSRLTLEMIAKEFGSELELAFANVVNQNNLLDTRLINYPFRISFGFDCSLSIRESTYDVKSRFKLSTCNSA